MWDLIIAMILCVIVGILLAIVAFIAVSASSTVINRMTKRAINNVSKPKGSVILPSDTEVSNWINDLPNQSTTYEDQ